MPVYEYPRWWQWTVSPTGFTVPTTNRDWYHSTTTPSATTLWQVADNHDWTWTTTITFNNTTGGGVLTAPPSEQLTAVRARRIAREHARISARDRADELLLSMLSPDQVADYVDNGAFNVIGSAGGRYRIRRGVSGNVDWLDADGQVGGRLCAHPTMENGWMPDQDVALAQLLALTTDEVAFVAVANVHAGRRPPILVAS